MDFGDITALGYGTVALGHLAFAIYLRASGRGANASGKLAWMLHGAVLATAAWGALSAAGSLTGIDTLRRLAPLADVGRYAFWFAFLLRLLPERRPEAAGGLRWAAMGGAGLAAAAFALHALGPAGPATQQLRLILSLALPVFGLLLVEQLFRNLGEDSRWNAKPLCLGLACIFAFDVYLFSEALLFSRFDADALSVRGLVHSLVLPFLLIASRRGNDWINRIHVSRAAAFYSATLVLAGLYLLFMAGVGYYVRYFGGTWGRALQLSLLVAGMAFLVVLVLSGSMRSRLRVFVGKHFYSYRYDYREEWLRFTALLSAQHAPEEMGCRVIRGLAELLECKGGGLWIRVGSDEVYTQSATWNFHRIEAAEGAQSSLCRFLQSNGWVIDLDEFRSSPRRYGELALPTWLLGVHNAWLVVPLLAGDDLLGFVVLAHPLAPQKLNWEVLDLLKTAGRQAAGHLAQMQATEALLDARKFEAFNRMSAFVVHDLKNIVAQLSLMLKNAERLHDNKEFQQDMLLTVESSLEKMRRLMLQLREGAQPPGGSRGVELTAVVSRLVAHAKSQGRELQVQPSERLATRGHEERLERVLGHLVQNALDATPTAGHVWIKTSRFSGQIKVEVGDNGVGMSDEF
ncbi:MAG: hypothetical protein RI907_2637, partial [Pseudomonadota bacterium]